MDAKEEVKSPAVPVVSKTQKLINYLKLVRRSSLSPEYQSFSRQLLEMVVVFVRCGMGPGCYLMAEMGKKEYDWHYKLGFLNGRQYVRRINQINDEKYYPATFNKLIEKAILANNSIPTPRMLGHLNVVNGRCCDGEELKTSKDLRALIERSHVEKLCFKLISGFGGVGFRAAEVVRNEGNITLLDLQEQQSYSVDEYYTALGISANGDFLVEQYFEQHPEIKKFNPSSVNTLRIMVYQPDGEAPRCLGVFIKFGREGSIVDNGSQGGLLAKIDMVTSTMHAGTYAFTRDYCFKHHPDTGVLIEGATVPLLAEAIALAGEAIQVFPGINYGGIDVAIGVDGPVVLELNARADYVDFSILNEPSIYALNE